MGHPAETQQASHLRRVPDDAGRVLRQPPVNADAERAVLGAVLLDPRVLGLLEGALDADDFYYGQHRTLFATLLEMVSEGRAIDPLTLENELTRAGTIDAIGGPLAIHEIRDSTPSAANARWYADIVRKDAIRRGLIAAAHEITEAAYDAGTEPIDVIDFAEQAAHEALAKYAPGSHQADRGVMAVARHIEDRKSDRRPLPIGLHTIDVLRDEGGHPTDWLTVIGAGTTIGKTALASSLAARTAESGTPVLYLTLESPSRVVWNTAASLWLRTPVKDALAQDTRRAVELAEQVARVPLHVCDRTGHETTLALIRGLVKRATAEHRVGWVFVDQLSWIARTDTSRNWKVMDWYTHCGKALKRLAGECETRIALLHQINRTGRKSRRPSVWDLEYAPGLEHVADQVILFDRDIGDRETEGQTLREDEAWVSVPKNREARTLREATVAWHGPTGVVAELPRRMPGSRSNAERGLPRGDR